MVFFWNKYKYVCLILGILLIKGTLLFWAAHPFDFWAFVNTLQRSTLYGWNIFEYWNKGNLLIAVWYPLYSLYLLILQMLSIQVDNILLLHFFFKIPFLFVDILSGFLIYKIVYKLSNHYGLAVTGFFMWFVNPLIFYSYGIHGHYEILVPFSLLLIIYGLLYESPLVTSLGFLIGIETKYFFIIFIPLVILFLLSQKKYLFITKGFLYLFTGLVVSYLHLFLNSLLLPQTLVSILHLSKANSPVGVDVIKLLPTNFASAVNYIFSPQTPISNLNHPFIFNLASHGLYLVGFFLVAHFFYRVYQTYYIKNKYTYFKLTNDLFLSLCYFLLFLTNFQAHYLIWLIPFFVLYVMKEGDLRFLYILILYTVVGFIYAFRGEIGTATFFLDIINMGSIDFMSLTDKYSQTVYREGAILIITLLITVFLIILPLKTSKSVTFFENKVTLYYIFAFVMWALILIPYGQAINLYFHQTVHFDNLAYNRGSKLNRGSISAVYDISYVAEKRAYFKNSNDFNSLVMQEVPKLVPADMHNFEVYILTSTSTGEALMQNIIFEGYLNECLLLQDQFNGKVLNKVDQLFYSGIKIPVDCLKKENNYVAFTHEDEAFHVELAKLYIHNNEVDFPFSNNQKMRIYGAAFLGIIYLLFFSIFTYFILKKICNKD